MTKKDIKFIQALVLIVISLCYFGFKTITQARVVIPQKGEFVYVERAVDGDTLKLLDGQRVRLIGVDTPEYHYSDKLLRDAKRTHKDIATIQSLGKKASDYTKALIAGKKVRLEFDVEKHDKYGRLLAYVYLDDGTFVNAKILEEGYGQVMTIPPNVRYAKHFLKLEQEARDKHKGLWGSVGEF